jgi:endonuclease VIII
MPEGDTIHRVATRLRPALVGQPLVRLDLPRVGPRARKPAPGTEITEVEAVGKHLLVRFADGAVLRTHLRMTGSWHLYETGQRWQTPPHLARAVVEVPGWVAVCFSAPVVELEHDALGGPQIQHLGPDLTRADLSDADLDVCVQRMATIPEPGDDIAVVLLDQRVACGVGNVFKSEVLWATRVDPFAKVADLDASTRRALVATAHTLLVRNAGSPGPRVTYGTGVAVYGRAGRPCPRCGTPIRRQRQGEQARTTFWCPSCQSPEERP